MSHEAAAMAAEEEDDCDYAIVKTTAAITGVQCFESGQKPISTIDDELACALSCAVEARDIESTIKQAAEERGKAANAKIGALPKEPQEAANPRPKARI